MNKCRDCKYEYLDGLEVKCRFNMEQFYKQEDEYCEHFKSRYIQFPLTIQGIQNNFNQNNMWSMYECGDLVKVKPCGKEYNDKTYLGILLGELPIGAIISFHNRDQQLHITPHCNPAIFIPELKKIVYGLECWWEKINNLEEFKEITSEDINNTWYVQLLKTIAEKKK